TTRPSGAARKAVSCPLDNRRAVALPAHLTAPSPAGQAPLALELGERVGAVLGVRTVLPFFSLRLSLLGLLVGTLGPQHGEEGLRHDAERDVPLPGLWSHLLGQLIHSLLLSSHLDVLLTVDRQGIGLLACFQACAQRAVTAIHGVAADPGGWHACIQRAPQHACC